MVFIILYDFVLVLLISTVIFPNLQYSIAEEITKAKDQTGELVNNLRLTHWDDWDVNATCPKGLYMIGLRLRYELEEVQNKNVSTVNGFELICSNRLTVHNKTFHTATLGKNGQWGNRTECKSGFAIGLSAKLSPLTNYFRSSSYILSINVYCSDSPRDITGKVLIHHPDYLQTEFEDARKHEQFCDPGDAITGISIRADSVITFYKGDSSSVKGLGIECRRVVNPASTCAMIFRWEPLPGMKCSEPTNHSKTQGDTMSRSKVNCTYRTWTGIGPNENSQENVTYTIKSYASIGAHNDEDFVKWSILVKLLQPDIKKWFLIKFPDKPHILDKFVANRLWQKINNLIGEIDYQYESPLLPNNLFNKIRQHIELKHEPVLEQLVGHCSTYKIPFDLFQTKNHVYFEKLIRNRLTRIVFELEGLA